MTQLHPCNPTADAVSPKSARAIEDWLVEHLAEVLHVVDGVIDRTAEFDTLGVDSADAVILVGELEQWLERPLSATLLWEHPSIRLLAIHLDPAASRESKSDHGSTQTKTRTDFSPPETASEPGTTGEIALDLDGPGRSVAPEPTLRPAASSSSPPIAVVGLACRLPGAPDPNAFWTLLRSGTDAITQVPRARRETPAPSRPLWGGFIHEVDGFDCEFFRISPREASRIDPQQRLLLEVTWEALEQSGFVADQLRGSRTGVFVGISSNEYGRLRPVDAGDLDIHEVVGNALSIAANRISYFFDLRGPSLAVDTACSSSLVAVHLACQSLHNHECDIAIVGGVSIVLWEELSDALAAAGMLAPGGRCRTFDATAEGYVRGEGCGVVVLERLPDAVRRRDRVSAVIRGSAVNQDGRSNGLTAPSGLAQQEVVEEALRRAGIGPQQLDYIEAHGTGTPLGDPVEVEALGRVLQPMDPRAQRCWIGSAKTNIGHLEAAAGIAGFIKVVLSLQHEEIPPHINYRQTNPHIHLDRVPLRIPTERQPWDAGERRRIAGVSSFGFGGTNAHVVIEEAGEEVVEEAGGEWPGVGVFPLSARSPQALQALVTALRDDLASADEEEDRRTIADLCYTASVRRSHHEHRAAWVVSSREQLVRELERYREQAPAPAGRPVFVFAGHGTQWAGMGRELLLREPVFRAVIEECERLIRHQVEWSLAEELSAEGEASQLERSAVAQPAIVAFGVGLAALWRSWGIEPGAVLGHSLGEVAAAQVAGVLSLEEAMSLAVVRGRLVQSTAGKGTMMAVAAAAAGVERLLAEVGAEGVEIAGVNGPLSTVLSGERTALAAVGQELAARRIRSQWLAIDHAFHGVQMEPLRAPLVQALTRLVPRPAVLPMVSTVSGEVAEGEALDAAYWGRNLRQPVRFAAAVERLVAQGERIFLEIGAHAVLGGALREGLAERGQTGVVLGSLRRGQAARGSMLRSLAALYTTGQTVQWGAVYREGGQCVRLPTYRFQRQRYWLDGGGANREAPLSAWCRERSYELTWRRLAMPEAATRNGGAGGRHWLILADRGGVAAALAKRLEAQRDTCTLVFADDEHLAGSFAPWLETVTRRHGGSGGAVVHLWSLDAEASPELTLEGLERAERLGCGSALQLVRSLLRAGEPLGPVWWVTQGAQATGMETAPVAAAQAPLWGLGRVLGLEHRELWGGLVDLDPAAPPAVAAAELAAVLAVGDEEDQLVLRGGERYGARLVRHEVGALPAAAWRADGTYLITGGLGSVGLTVAAEMVARGARHLVLVGRRGVPQREQWEGLAADGALGRQVAAIRALEAQGATVRVMAADVGEPAQMAALFAALEREGPPLRGILHAAGVVQVAAVAELDLATLQEVGRAKVRGAWVLHELSRELSLEVFVLFSSAAAVWGSRGLAAYAAANHFLDALAHHRRRLGLPALSINWGPWAGGGMASAEAQAGLSRLGVAALSPLSASQALGSLVATGLTQLTVAQVDWDVFRPVYQARAQRPLLHELGQPPANPGDAKPVERSELRRRLEEAPHAARHRMLSLHLEQEVAQVLGLEAAALPSHKGFFDLGMDSLMAVELTERLQTTLACTFSTTAVFDHPTIDSLSSFLAHLLHLLPLPRQRDPSDDGPDGHATLIQLIESMSDTEIERRLSQRLAEIVGER